MEVDEVGLSQQMDINNEGQDAACQAIQRFADHVCVAYEING
jgi:hypothetical protein